MKKLVNLPISGHLYNHDFNSDFLVIENFLGKNKLDGLEVILSGDYQVNDMDTNLIIGHHLMYWPNWMDIWYGHQSKLMEEFMTEENIYAYYGFRDKTGMIDYLKREFSIAKELGVEYMVFHVSHSHFEEVFTFNHEYSHKEIMVAAIELINEVFQGEGPLLLFENMWLPGLTFEDPLLMKWFIGQIDYKQKGFLLDIAHLMSTNKTIITVDDGIDYVLKILDDLGDIVDLIKGIHLSKAIAGPYLSKDHSDLHQLFKTKETLLDRFQLIGQHIKQIDNHIPFDHIRIMEIINKIKPDYLVYEFIVNDLDELEEMIQLQHQFIITSH